MSARVGASVRPTVDIMDWADVAKDEILADDDECVSTRRAHGGMRRERRSADIC